KSFKIIGIVASHFKKTHDFTLPADREIQMLSANGYPIGHRWRRQMLSRLHKMLYFVKNPWVSNAGPANHYAVDAIPIFILQCFFGRIYIAVSENRNLNTGVVFNLADERPVSIAFVHLHARPAVDGE